MRRLDVYQDGLPPFSALEMTGPIDRDSYPEAGTRNADGTRLGRACDRCALSARKGKAGLGLRNPCIQGTGEPGGLLLIGEYPVKEDDDTGRSLQGKAGRLVRSLVERYWKAPWAFDHALKCAPGRLKVTDKQADSCRPFLASALEEVQPARVITLGGWAAYSVFGRSVPPLTSRGAYGWLRGEKGAIPVFMVQNPSFAMRNRFVEDWFREDLHHALTCPDPPRGPWGAKAHLIETPADARAAASELMVSDWVAFDVETMGTIFTPDFRMISCAVVGDADEDPFVWPEAALYDPAMRGPLERLLTSPELGKVGSNVKYDQLAWRSAFGIEPGPIVGDTRLSRKLVDPEAGGKLSAMAELVGMGGLKQDAEERMAWIANEAKKRVRKQWHKKPKPLVASEPLVPTVPLHPVIDAALRSATAEQLNPIVDRYQYGMLPLPELVAYNARDSIATARVEHYVREELEAEPSLRMVWDDLVLPCARALVSVEAWGIAASRGAIAAFDGFLTAKEKTIAAQLAQYPGIDWNSNDQIAELLFKKLGLPCVKKTPTGKPCTDESVLDSLKGKHPICEAIIDWRSVTKMKGTYASGMLVHIRPDGRIHPNIKLDGARSGRMSCVDPNLQNIPRAKDSQEGKMARDCFVAPPGFKLLEVDYSQLELRVAALLSGDPIMANIFKSGVDYHLRTAQLISQLAWGKRPEDVGETERSLAKSVNFGILYGKTAYSLAKEWGTSTAKAQAIVDAVMGNFKVLGAWCKARRSEAAKTGEVWTQWNGKQARRRPLYRIGDRGAEPTMQAITAGNGAVNSPIQGTASDYCAASLAKVVDWIHVEGIEDSVKTVLAVHDAIMLEVRDEMVEESAHVLREILTGYDTGDVALEVDFKAGQAWGSMQSYKLAA